MVQVNDKARKNAGFVVNIKIDIAVKSLSNKVAQILV